MCYLSRETRIENMAMSVFRVTEELKDLLRRCIKNIDKENCLKVREYVQCKRRQYIRKKIFWRRFFNKPLDIDLPSHKEMRVILDKMQKDAGVCEGFDMWMKLNPCHAETWRTIASNTLASCEKEPAPRRVLIPTTAVSAIHNWAK